MGDPYQGGPYPACSSDFTFSYCHATRYQLGYGSRCGACGTVWDLLPAADQDDLDQLTGRLPPSPHSASPLREGTLMNEDALLRALQDARLRKEEAEHDIRILLAYARELLTPRPYRLIDLARAAGLSISGVRTAYTGSDIEHAARILMPASGQPRRDDRHIATAVAALLASRKPGPGPSPAEPAARVVPPVRSA